MNKVKFPKISIVTPSFNQSQFLEETIQSVLSQNYPNLEYIIIDGGSTDNSVDSIKKYADKLAYWVSEPDRGHSDALNKGFARSTGEIMAWINSDDKYFPWTFLTVSQIFTALPEIEWLTSSIKLRLNKRGLMCERNTFVSLGKAAFKKGYYLPDRGNCIPQESTFWRRPLWEKAGSYVDEDSCIVPDFGLWARFWQQASNVYTISVPLGCIRVHQEQVSSRLFDKCCLKAKTIWRKHGGYRPSRVYQIVRRLLLKIPLTTYMIRKNNRVVVYDPKAETWRITEPINLFKIFRFPFVILLRIFRNVV